MDKEKIKRNIYIIKILSALIFGIIIFFILYKKPEISKDLKENFIEVNLKTYGGNLTEKAWDLKKFNNNLYILADTKSYGIGGTDIYLLKTDFNGNLLSARTFGYPGNDAGISMLISKDKFIYIVGGTDYDGVSTSDIYVLKCTLDGEVIWQKTYGDDNYDFAYDIIEDDNNFLICGYTSSNKNNSDFYLLKIDKNGNILWEKIFGGPGWDISYNIIKIKNDFLLTGYTNSFGNGKTDIYLAKVDTNGNCLWAKTYGGLRDDMGVASLNINNDEILIAGNSSSYISRGFGMDILLFKIDSDGNSLLTKVFPTAQLEAETKLLKVDDDFLLAGNKKCYGICDSNIYLLKIDKNLDVIWFKIFAGKRNDFTSSIIKINDKYYISGTTTSFYDIKGDIFLSCIDKDGNFSLFYSFESLLLFRSHLTDCSANYLSI